MKLNDTHMILLSTASQRENGSLLALPDDIGGARATRALTALAKIGLAEERETADADATARTDGDLRFGLFVTAAALQAIGIEPVDAGAQDSDDTPAAAPPRATKGSTVLALLGRAEGATLTELIAATGWLPHTTRAALTRLRKKGHSITRGRRDGTTCYTVVAA